MHFTALCFKSLFQKNAEKVFSQKSNLDNFKMSKNEFSKKNPKFIFLLF